MNSESSREMTPMRHHDVLTSPFHERLPIHEPPRGYQSEGHGGLQLSRGYAGYIIPLSIGLGMGAGYGAYRIYGRFKENPSEVNASLIATVLPSPTPTIKPNIMYNRRFHPKPN